MSAPNYACSGRQVGPAKKANLGEQFFSVSLAHSPSRR